MILLYACDGFTKRRERVLNLLIPFLRLQQKLGSVFSISIYGVNGNDILVNMTRFCRADEWNVNKWAWEGALKVISKGEECIIRLEDKKTGYFLILYLQRKDWCACQKVLFILLTFISHFNL